MKSQSDALVIALTGREIPCSREAIYTGRADSKIFLISLDNKVFSLATHVHTWWSRRHIISPLFSNMLEKITHAMLLEKNSNNFEVSSKIFTDTSHTGTRMILLLLLIFDMTLTRKTPQNHMGEFYTYCANLKLIAEYFYCMFYIMNCLHWQTWTIKFFT